MRLESLFLCAQMGRLLFWRKENVRQIKRDKLEFITKTIIIGSHKAIEEA